MVNDNWDSEHIQKITVDYDKNGRVTHPFFKEPQKPTTSHYFLYRGIKDVPSNRHYVAHYYIMFHSPYWRIKCLDCQMWFHQIDNHFKPQCESCWIDSTLWYRNNGWDNYNDGWRNNFS